MRHGIANLLYRMGRALDRPRQASWSESRFGDEGKSNAPEFSTTNASIHTRSDTAITGTFTPGDYTYAALTVGDGSQVTVFLNRTTTQKIMTILTEVEARYCKYGEGRRS